MERVTTAARRMTDRLAGVNVAWYGARPLAGRGTRGSRLRELVLELAQLGHEAGNGAPAAVVPNVLGVHALADQITVLVTDIVQAPGSGVVADRALVALSDCDRDLWSR